ncbi:BTAD domain-containing putative transcriptional regulator [Rhodococcus sp. NPDC059234]|uniref:AfsR/SARP family transcriptional regulator n=1 Tax=Rhodococcus sp. NPDC059234 TaxID=3346781 RepID=UPI003671A844
MPEPSVPAAIRLGLLGSFRAERMGTRLPLSPGGQRLLATLTLRGITSRTAIADLLWPEATEQHALGSLRSTLWRLHQTDADLVHNRGENLALGPVDVDLLRFVAWAHRLTDSAATPDEADLDLAHLSEGELLPGWYEDWVLFERERLRQLRLHAIEAMACHLCRRRRFTAAVETALEATRVEPLRESAHRTLIWIHLCEDNIAEAMRHFALFRKTIHDELGVEPSTRLQALISSHISRSRAGHSRLRVTGR